MTSPHGLKVGYLLLHVARNSFLPLLDLDLRLSGRIGCPPIPSLVRTFLSSLLSALGHKREEATTVTLALLDSANFS